jgi:hypothetical protein
MDPDLRIHTYDFPVLDQDPYLEPDPEVIFASIISVLSTVL